MTAELRRQCATITGLSPGQSFGKICAGTCGRNFLQPPYPEQIRVGISEYGGVVFACPECAAADPDRGGFGFNPDDGWQAGRS